MSIVTSMTIIVSEKTKALAIQTELLICTVVVLLVEAVTFDIQRTLVSSVSVVLSAKVRPLVMV